MNKRFQNPPLREIIAELTWDVPEAEGRGDTEPIFYQAYEEAFEEFIDFVAERGYSRSERLVPLNYPIPSNVAVFRARHREHRHSDSAEAKVLYQIGAGVFTANALPPYESWDEFSPLVKAGVEDFFRVNMPGGLPERLRPTLRYINAFSGDLVGDISHKDFLCDVLKLNVQFPGGVVQECHGELEIPRVDILLPFEFGAMVARFAKGKVSGDDAHILDMTVQYNEEFPPDIELVMDAYSKGRQKIHNVFLELTRSIHDKMGLKEV
jgi:uncharacterized protein (TIGR04255 family)